MCSYRPRGFETRDVRRGDVYIYALVRPGTTAERYIGKTENPARRFKAQMCARSPLYVYAWIKALRRRGIVPEMVILETVPAGKNTTTREAAHIRRACAEGKDVLNGHLPLRCKRPPRWAKASDRRRMAKRIEREEP